MHLEHSERVRCMGCNAFISTRYTLTTCKRCGGLNADARTGHAENPHAAMAVTQPGRLFYPAEARP